MAGREHEVKCGPRKVQDLCRVSRRPTVSKEVVDLDAEKYSFGLEKVLPRAGVVALEAEGVAHGFVAVFDR